MRNWILDLCISYFDTVTWVTETLPCEIPLQDFCAVLFNELMNYNKNFKDIARKNMENTTKQTCSSSSSGKGRRFFLMRSWSSTWINLKKSWCMTLAWKKYKFKKKKEEERKKWIKNRSHVDFLRVLHKKWTWDFCTARREKRERCFSSCQECGTKKNSESPWGIKH